MLSGALRLLGSILVLLFALALMDVIPWSLVLLFLLPVLFHGEKENGKGGAP